MEEESWEGTLFVPGAVFALFSIAAIWPPDEFVSAGATFENVFWRWIGDASTNVVHYQLRKILVNRVCVMCLPGIFAAYILLNVDPTTQSAYVLTACLASTILGLTYAFFTVVTNFKYMRQMKELALYGADTDRLMAEITAEYREHASFGVSFAHSSKLVFGNNWLIRITRFDFTIVKLADVAFQVVRTTMHLNRDEENDDADLQFIDINAQIQGKDVRGFRFRVPTAYYRDLQERVGVPIVVERDVVMKPPLNERFVKAFIDYIGKNPRTVYTRMAELEPCFGCSTKQPDVKIEKRCTLGLANAPPCRQCACRPMFCSGCLGRIFAEKQKNYDPDQWLDGQASCPTCRAPFCMLDVSFIVANEAQLRAKRRGRSKSRKRN